MIDINISKVCKSFGFDLVLNNIDITVQKGEKVGLIGTNGSGKSTILKIIAGQESIDSGSLSIRNNISIGYLSQIPEEKDIIVKDYINSAFKEIIELKEKLERYENKLLTEDYKVITKYMNLQEKFISLGGYEYETKIQKILPVFNITEEILNRNFNTLSGGEKTIISLIRLLLQEPDVLLLDEPTNHLDINKMIWLEKTLKNYKGTIMLVSHDRYFMDNVINKVYLLTKRGIEVYHGNYSYYIKESENRLLLELKNYKDQQKQITAMKNSIKRLKEYGRLCGPSGGEIFFRRAASIEKRLEKLEKLDKPEDKKKLNLGMKMNPMFNDGAAKENNFFNLNPDNYIHSFVEFFKYWVFDTDCNINVSTCMNFANLIINEYSGICTHSSCLKKWLCLDSNGHIYPCDRLCLNEYDLGYVPEMNVIDEAFENEKFIKLLQKNILRRQTCIETCEYFKNCYGGCNANAILSEINNNDISCYIQRGILSELKKIIIKLECEKNYDKLNYNFAKILIKKER